MFRGKRWRQRGCWPRDRGTLHKHGPTNHFSPNTSLCTPHVFQHRGFACTVTTSTRTNISESRVVQETARKSRGVNGCMVWAPDRENDDTGYCDTGSGLLDHFRARTRFIVLRRQCSTSSPSVGLTENGLLPATQGDTGPSCEQTS